MITPVFRALIGGLMVFSALVPLVAAAQTTTDGPAIDVEVFNPADGSNLFCAQPGSTLTARLFIRPGTQNTSCTPSCGSVVPGGTAHLATALLDLEFDPARLTFTSASNNGGTAAVDGLIQDNAGTGRIGWALAGDWTPNATTSGLLANPCSMGLLDQAGWVTEMEFTVPTAASGLTVLHLRRAADEFPLSMADLCGDEAFREDNGGIDEIVDAQVLIAPDCSSALFFDGFETSDTGRW